MKIIKILKFVLSVIFAPFLMCGLYAIYAIILFSPIFILSKIGFFHLVNNVIVKFSSSNFPLLDISYAHDLSFGICLIFGAGIGALLLHFIVSKTSLKEFPPFK